ncbi:hypothetical protein [Leucobacter sp. VD1]|uniref:hypothetical protein n=1 Tax=Leucobacter sp. VD1 TaxID=3080381 RepID=UPI003018D73C
MFVSVVEGMFHSLSMWTKWGTMRGEKRASITAHVLVIGGLILPLALTSCAAEEQQPEDVRASYDSVNLTGDQKQELMNLSNGLDAQVQAGARVDLVIDPDTSTEAVAQIVLPSDHVVPTSDDLTAVLEAIDQSTTATAFAWRVEAVSPTGARVSLAETAREAGVSPVQISPFGDIRIEAPLEEEQS